MQEENIHINFYVNNMEIVNDTYDIVLEYKNISTYRHKHVHRLAVKII